MIRRKFLLLPAAAALAATVFAGGASAADKPSRITVDWAYYNPVALLLKNKGWLEKEFAKDGIKIRWVLSLGSNKALEFLNGGSADFASTAGGASVIGRANGIKIKAVYIYSKPEWTALVTLPKTGVKSVRDLKGKRVAVTRGTDPHIFLLQALASNGLTEKDIKVVLLQHPDGFRALARGHVDAWAGLDPHMAKAELDHGARLFHRNADLNTYGVLNVREQFAKDHPDLVVRVLRVYEQARRYSIANPDELRGYLVKVTRVSDAVARKQLEERTDLSNPVINAATRKTLLAAGAELQKIGIIRKGVDVPAIVSDLIDTRYIERVQASR